MKSKLKDEPWYKTTLKLNKFGNELSLHVPHDVFSTINIDEGTLLLLDHLPKKKPKVVLDMGCGYGALGLPIAASFKDAQIEMVDRDLLAVEWARKNAISNNLLNTSIKGSLGYRDLDLNHSALSKYDWILCNVPARIGSPFITHLLKAGQALLQPQGEIRLVVIRDLAPIVEEICNQHHWPIKEEARGPRHVILSVKKEHPLTATFEQIAADQDLYFRDNIEIAGIKLERPFDLHSDDPKYLNIGLPILIDALPKQAPKNVFCFRSGYGQLPMIANSRWPSSPIVAADRDLLTTDFTRRNAKRLNVSNELLSVRESAHFPNAISENETFELIIGELSSAAGQRATESELLAIAKALAKGGQALVLCLDKINKEWVQPFAQKQKLSIYPMISRQGYSLLRLTK